MNQREYRSFLYLEKQDYDKTIKINEDDLKVYSKKKLNDLYPDDGYAIVGETFEKKKRDRKKDIGRIELNEKQLYVSENGRHNRLFKKQGAFVAVDGGGFIALLKLRLLPILLLLVLLLGWLAGTWVGIRGGRNPADREIDPGIVPVENEILTVTGVVTKEQNGVEGAELSLQSGNQEVGHATTDKDGNYLIGDVKNGNYNLVCTYGDSVLTKMATVSGMSIVVNFTFPSDDLHDVEEITDHHNTEDLPEIKPAEEPSEVKAIVKVPEGTDAIAVDGLDTEAMLHMIVSREVDLTLCTEKLDESRVPATDKAAITAISGELNLTYYNFSVLKETFINRVPESSEYLKSTKTVLEFAVPYDSTMAMGTYVFRCCDGRAIRFEELSVKPAENFQDATYYVTADTVYIYANRFSTYAIGSVSAGKVVRGSDTITYSDKATINLKSGKIDMLYKHDEDSTNDVRIELYLIGENSNLLVAQSGTIPVGYEISEMNLLEDIRNMPSVGTYNALMKIIYLGTAGDTNTNVDIPLSIAITQ